MNSEEARRLKIRPTKRYGHGSALYETDGWALGLNRCSSCSSLDCCNVTLRDLNRNDATALSAMHAHQRTCLGRWAEAFAMRSEAICDGRVDGSSGAVGAQTDPISFLFIYGGNNGTHLLDELWAFAFARNPAWIDHSSSALFNRLPFHSARYDAFKGPYAGWIRLDPVPWSGAGAPVPLIHPQLVYVETEGADNLSAEERDTTSPAGSLYIIGGMQQPLDRVAEGVGSWGADGGCPNDGGPGPCISERCCWRVEGVMRDTAGLVNGIWKVSDIFNNKVSTSSSRIEVRGAVPSARFEHAQSVAAESPTMFIVGGAMGPKNMNTKFNGGDYGVTSPEVWSDDVSPVQLKDRDLWIFDMETLEWELPSDPQTVSPDCSNTAPANCSSAATSGGQETSQNCEGTPVSATQRLCAACAGTEISPRGGQACEPGGRSAHSSALAYHDEVTSLPTSLVIFGGLDQYDDARNDVWAFDLTLMLWRPVYTFDPAEESQTAPHRRHTQAMLHRWLNGRETLVVYGGVDGFGGVLDDLWVFDLTIAAREMHEQACIGGYCTYARCAAEKCWSKVLLHNQPAGRRAPLFIPVSNTTILMFGGQTQVATASLYVGGQTPKQFADDSYTDKKGGEFGSTAYPNGGPTVSELWVLNGSADSPMNDWEWQKVREDPLATSPRLGVYHGNWSGEGGRMRPYIDLPEPRAFATGVGGSCFGSDACNARRIWMVGGCAACCGTCAVGRSDPAPPMIGTR